MFTSGFHQAGPSHGGEKIPFHLLVTQLHDGIPRDEDEVRRRIQFRRMASPRLAEQAPRTTAHHGAAEFATGDDAQASGARRRGGVPVGNETTLNHPAPLPFQSGEIAARLQAHGSGQTQPLRNVRGHQTGVRRLRPTRRRLARMPRPLLEDLRARKPCWRRRRTFEGWYCRFMLRQCCVSRPELRHKPAWGCAPAAGWGRPGVASSSRFRTPGPTIRGSPRLSGVRRVTLKGGVSSKPRRPGLPRPRRTRRATSTTRSFPKRAWCPGSPDGRCRRRHTNHVRAPRSRVAHRLPPIG